MGVIQALFQNDVELQRLLIVCRLTMQGGHMPGAAQQMRFPIYQDHVTIHLHYGSLVFKICSKVDKHMLAGCQVSMFLRVIYYTQQVAGQINVFLICKNHLELCLDFYVKTLKCQRTHEAKTHRLARTTTEHSTFDANIL